MDSDEKILQLLPHKKKGIFRFLFSRIILVAFLILFQILLFLVVYGWLRDYLPHFVIFQAAFSIGMLIYLFNCSMDSSAKLTWLAIIMIFPIPGTFLLLYTKFNVGYRALKNSISERIEETMNFLPQDQELLKDPQLQQSGTLSLYHYLNNTGCFPLYRNTKVTYFPSGEAKFESLLQSLRSAEKFIFMEYFILAEGEMWGQILAILAEKAKQGVDVRVMFDGMCEASTLSFDYPKRVEKYGIRCKDFAPITPLLSTHYNYRDHRKILVIDGKIAYNGGVNLADEYINRLPRFGHWKDTAVMLEGEAVQSFTLMFLQMWNISERNPDWSPCKEPPVPVPAEGYVIPYGDSPLDTDKVGENIYMDILYRATSFVHIMTPYLILDDELKAALKFVAQRGVEIKLILPGIPDKRTAYALAKTHYKELTEAGVQIYEYTPGFVHAKVFVSDNEKAVVGTINLDYRSLYHHFECATYLYKSSCIPDIEKDFQETLTKCRAVTPDTIRHEKTSYKIAGKILKIFSPLL